MTLNKFLIYLSLTTYMMTTNAATNLGNNLPTTNNTANAPTINPYYGYDGKFAGNSQSVNGGTSYYNNNGQYQGQAPTGNNVYYNQSGQPQLINSPAQPLNHPNN